MKTYKVWIEIEEYDDETDESTDHDPGFSSSAEFDTLEEAEAFANELHDHAEAIA